MGTEAFDFEAIDAEIKKAKERTDDRLASRISSVTRLTDAEVKAMFPEPADAEKLVELMRIVKEGTDVTDRANRLASNIKNLGGVVVTLLEKFVA